MLWLRYPDQVAASTAFQQLSWLSSIATVKANLQTIEKFVIGAFLSDIHAGSTIDETRYKLFLSSTSNNLRELPPWMDALEQHVLRSAYQAD